MSEIDNEITRQLSELDQLSAHLEQLAEVSGRYRTALLANLPQVLADEMFRAWMNTYWGNDECDCDEED